MKTTGLFWALSWVTMVSLAAMQGCGGDDDDDGGTSKGGSAGEAGSDSGGSSGSGTGGRGGGGQGGTSTGGQGGTSTGGTGPGGAGGDEGGGAGGDDGEGGSDGGGGDRASACDAYCGFYYEAGCDGFDTNDYDDEADCNATCVAADWDLGMESDSNGNTVHCRRFHAFLASGASGDDIETHCGHASAVPTANCTE